MPRKKPKDTPQLSTGEWKVMRALWREHPATARELLDELGDETQWAYTTLKTMLTRLVDKGFVAEKRQNGAGVYEPLIREEEARGHAVEGLLTRAFDGAFGSLVHFMLENKQLSARDKTELARLIAEAEPRSDSKKGGGAR